MLLDSNVSVQTLDLDAAPAQPTVSVGPGGLTSDIDTTAALSADGARLTVRVLNRRNASATIKLSVAGTPNTGGWAAESITLAATLNATNSPAAPDNVSPGPAVRSHWDSGKPNNLAVPPFSYTIYRLNLTTAVTGMVDRDA